MCWRAPYAAVPLPPLARARSCSVLSEAHCSHRAKHAALASMQVQHDMEPLILEGVEASSTDAPQQAIGALRAGLPASTPNREGHIGSLTNTVLEAVLLHHVTLPPLTGIRCHAGG